MAHSTLLFVLFLASVGVNVCFRLLYVFWVGFALKKAKVRRTEHENHFERWLVFKRKASLILGIEAASFVAASATSFGTLPFSASYFWLLLPGIPLTVVGLGVKMSAARIVGEKGYYWYNFFCPDEDLHYSPTGVYRYLKNPMYGIGYLQVLGIPLLFKSLWGLPVGLFDWALVWVFYLSFERSHTENVVAESGSPQVSNRWE